ncbi:MAG: SMC-Scp complex subunit ScpB [Hyphomicrobiaceae bacterium]|nr:SMC-Scp complex subunit ScpB [Hyphomicrobiaceae bacterium]
MSGAQGERPGGAEARRLKLVASGGRAVAADAVGGNDGIAGDAVPAAAGAAAAGSAPPAARPMCFSSASGSGRRGASSETGDAGATPDPVSRLAETDRRHKLRTIEAMLFAAATPLSESQLAERFPAGTDLSSLLGELAAHYAERGVVLTRVAGKWAFRTAPDLGHLLDRFRSQERRLSKAALETLAIIAYHQPVTRAEIEEIRGVSTSAGTLDTLIETGWVRPRGRRRTPGRPVTYGTTDTFLEAFALDSVRDLPGLADLRAAGLLDAAIPAGFDMPEPRDVAALLPDEMPLDGDEAGGPDQADLAFDGDSEDEEVAEDERSGGSGTPGPDLPPPAGADKPGAR